MSLALSKTLDPADFTELAEELKIVDQYFTSAREQHPMRRWEYAIALRAVREWHPPVAPTVIYDVGGAGSPFSSMLDHIAMPANIVDPDIEHHKGYRATLDEFVQGGSRLAHAVFCLSVLEHVDDLDQFLYHLSCLVAPGGLLFLTMDYANDLGDINSGGWPIDNFHFHWMRKRIFNAWTLGRVVAGPLMQLTFSHLGDADLTWHGPQVYNYTFASLALVKRS
jgi:hypothetical protein